MNLVTSKPCPPIHQWVLPGRKEEDGGRSGPTDDDSWNQRVPAEDEMVAVFQDLFDHTCRAEEGSVGALGRA